MDWPVVPWSLREILLYVQALFSLRTQGEGRANRRGAGSPTLRSKYRLTSETQGREPLQTIFKALK